MIGRDAMFGQDVVLTMQESSTLLNLLSTP